MKNVITFLLVGLGLTLQASAQDTAPVDRQYKNVIRYNLSGAALFGFSQYIVLGYERVVSPHQSFSVNVGIASLPKLATIQTDSFSLSKDASSKGFNISADYRFYLAKENKFNAPHGLYIGPWASYNHFSKSNDWQFKNPNGKNFISTESDFSIASFGFELGYQFVLWKRLTLDLIMIGPGLGFYNYQATFDSNVTVEEKSQLLDALKQAATQKFPGMNYVLSDHQFNANGNINTSTVGYRYIVHIGFLF